MVSRGGEKIEKFGRACQKREGKPALCYAESGEIGGSGTGRGRSPAPPRIQGGGTGGDGGGTSGLRGSFAEGGARGVPHPLRRAENFPGPDRLDPGEVAPGGPVWDVSSLPGALEEILSVDLLEPEGLHDEGAGRAYALTADPEFSSIAITSAALSWKGQTRTMAVTLFPNSAGQRITDDTAGPGSVQGGCAAAGSR